MRNELKQHGPPILNNNSIEIRMRGIGAKNILKPVCFSEENKNNYQLETSSDMHVKKFWSKCLQIKKKV